MVFLLLKYKGIDVASELKDDEQLFFLIFIQEA